MRRALLVAALLTLADRAFAEATPSGDEPPAVVELAGTASDAFLLQSLGAPRAAPLSGSALARRTHEVASLIRCPVCQGTSVADSPSTMALNMKEEVRSLLGQGYDEEQVLQYFELAYGEYIRLQPRADGFNALLWLLPVLVLVGGLGAVALALRGQRAPAPSPETDAATEPPEPELARYLVEARRLARRAGPGEAGDDR